MKRNRESEYMNILREKRKKMSNASPLNVNIDVYEFREENIEPNSENSTKISPNLNNENSTIPDLNTELKYDIIQGKRRGSKLLWVHCERQFYVGNSMNKKGKAFTCNASNACRARIIVHNNGKCFRLNSDPHKHGTGEDLFRELTVLAEIKLDVASSSSSRGTIQDIFNDHLSK